MERLPFDVALGSKLDKAAPTVREHFTLPQGCWKYRGLMNEVWRAGGLRGRLAFPFLAIGRWSDTLFSQTGFNIPFELEHRIRVDPHGCVLMTWTRTFHFPGKAQRFHAEMAFDDKRGRLIDWIGRNGHLEVELEARIEDGDMILESGRQRIRCFGTWWSLPKWLAGHARVREFPMEGHRLGIEVSISNPMLGAFFGYKGAFERVSGYEEDEKLRDVAVQARPARPCEMIPGNTSL